jgi:hypothetical protein
MRESQQKSMQLSLTENSQQQQEQQQQRQLENIVCLQVGMYSCCTAGDKLQPACAYTAAVLHQISPLLQ